MRGDATRSSELAALSSVLRQSKQWVSLVEKFSSVKWDNVNIARLLLLPGQWQCLATRWQTDSSIESTLIIIIKNSSRCSKVLEQNEHFYASWDKSSLLNLLLSWHFDCAFGVEYLQIFAGFGFLWHSPTQHFRSSKLIEFQQVAIAQASAGKCTKCPGISGSDDGRPFRVALANEWPWPAVRIDRVNEELVVWLCLPFGSGSDICLLSHCELCLPIVICWHWQSANIDALGEINQWEREEKK